MGDAEGEPRGGVLVIHENKGLTDHIRSVAGRLAASGYAALAPDLLSEEGGTAAIGDPAKVTATLGTVPPTRFIADLRAALTELSARVEDRKLGAVGFCFGGGLVWRLLAAGEPGSAPPSRSTARCPTSRTSPLGRGRARHLRRTGRPGQRQPRRRRGGVRAAGLPHEIVTYPGVDHAFFNDTGPRYNAEAAADAYQRVLNWFDRYLSA
ncbi:dienelactone hydrolase family protein [Luedemannella flava]